MIINKKKSALLRIKEDATKISETIQDYPTTTSYVYLGMRLNYKMDCKEHLRYIGKKITYLTWKLKIIRKKGNLKLNNNLFKTFIEPLYRLGYTMYEHAGKDEKKVF